jgi:hypothetical protein
MSWFRRWYTLIAFEARKGQRDPRALHADFNIGSPVEVPENEFSWQRRSDGTVLGWVLLRGWLDARRVRRWLRGDLVLRYVAEGEVAADCLDAFQWGVE